MNIANGLHLPFEVYIRDDSLSEFAGYAEIVYAPNLDAARRVAAETYPDQPIVAVRRLAIFNHRRTCAHA